MANPFNRGSAPDRARDAWTRPGSFKSGHAKLGGRKKGNIDRLQEGTFRGGLSSWKRWQR
jgi:hypothetical protein